MGRRPPLFFTQARRVVPQRCGITCCGARPALKSLTTPARARIAWSARSGEGHETASFRWFARRLDGPGAEPPGKDFSALRTSWSEMLGGGGVGSGVATVQIRSWTLLPPRLISSWCYKGKINNVAILLKPLRSGDMA